MKFMSIFVTAAAATATLNQRQVSVISDALASIQSSTSSLDTAINGFSGADQAGPLQSQAASLVSLIQSSTTSINGIAPLSSNDALSLTQPLQDLAKVVDTAINDLISKKSTFASSGVGGVVYSTLTSLQSAAADLTKAALSKVPDGLQSAGQSFAAPIAASLQKGVSAFQEFANGGGSSGSSSGGSGSSTSAPTGSSGSSYPTSSSSPSGSGSYPASTTTAKPTGATTSTLPTYTGAANKAASGFGAAAAAAIAVAALV